MRILQVDKFFYIKGGPEKYMFSLSELLRSKGHEIAYFSMMDEKNVKSPWSDYFIKNVEYNKDHGLIEKIKIFKEILYSKEAEDKMISIIDAFRPDIAHLHTFNHQLTPSILHALDKKKIPFVVTLHDYKLICPSYMMLDHGAICERCKGQRFYNCLMRGCHKDSYSKSLSVTLESYLHHRILNSYRPTKSYICPSRFMMEESKKMGLEGEFVYLPHFADVKEDNYIERKKKKRIVYFGRLSAEKGIMTLLKAVKGLQIELIIIGDGPMRGAIEDFIRSEGLNNVELAGYLEGQDLMDKVGECIFSVVPSEWFEVFGLTIIESYALGLPVIGSRIGAIPEIIKDGETGLLFEPCNVSELRDKILKLSNEPDMISLMGREAYSKAIKEYVPDAHYKALIDIYKNAIGRHG